MAKKKEQPLHFIDSNYWIYNALNIKTVYKQTAAYDVLTEKFILNLN